VLPYIKYEEVYIKYEKVYIKYERRFLKPIPALSFRGVKKL